MARIQEFAQVSRVDHKGREYAGPFWTRKNHTGPGYVVMGRSTGGEYGGNLVQVCARLVKRDRAGRVTYTGWRREWDAYQFALYLTGTDLGTIK